MGIDPIVDMAISMKFQSVREQAGFQVAKLALDMMEQTGGDIAKLLESGVSLDPNLGNMIDISV